MNDPIAAHDTAWLINNYLDAYQESNWKTADHIRDVLKDRQYKIEVHKVKRLNKVVVWFVGLHWELPTLRSELHYA